MAVATQEDTVTGCEKYLTGEWAAKVHALMIELCGECTCHDEALIEALWIEDQVKRAPLTPEADYSSVSRGRCMGAMPGSGGAESGRAVWSAVTSRA